MNIITATINTWIHKFAVDCATAWNIAVRLIYAFFQWRYSTTTIALLALTIVVTVSYPSYTRWRRGWLSGLVEERLRAIRITQARRNRSAILSALTRPRLYPRILKHSLFSIILSAANYLRRDFGTALGNIYLPSFTSVGIALCALAGFMYFPDHPKHLSDAYTPSTWLAHFSRSLDNYDGIAKVIEGLIVVIIALIIFVAESIRTSRSSDEKRVLLSVSYLWVLTLGITLLPLAFLYPPGSQWAIAVVFALALFTLFAFGRVLTSLISPSDIGIAQRKFLRKRVHDIVMESARQRMGNRILFDKLGASKEIKISPTISRSWLPGDESDFVFVDTNADGILYDINLNELASLAVLLGQRATELDPIDPPTNEVGVAGPTPRSPRARREAPKDTGVYLVRRFREELTSDARGTFARDKSIIAIKKTLAKRPGLIEDVESRLAQIFRFSKKEPPSRLFRQELQSIKDRLILALRSGVLGEIDDLRDVYLLVAEEFLTALNELGGGYSAEQARQERSDVFGNWNELRWLREDVRDLIIVAADTLNRDVIGKIIILPFAIMSRAFVADDQLLFQEFMTFGSLIYLEGQKRADTEAGRYMIERAWGNVKDILRFYVEPAFREGDSDDE